MMIFFIAAAAILPLLVLPNVSCLASVKPSPLLVISRRKNGSLQEYAFVDGTTTGTTATTTTTTSTTTTTTSSSHHSNKRSKYTGGPQQRLSYWIRSTFLPMGYPTSVRPRYMEFSIWSALQDWSTNLRSTLATQRILEAVGVGQSTATALSAVQSFLVRDAAGMVATLIFTASTQFGPNVKQWRIFADILVDIGITLEVAAIHVPKQYFLLMLCLGNIAKALCGVAAGAAGVPLIQYWGNDTADVSAKAGAQRTVIGGVGLIVSVLFARYCAQAKPSHVWSIYIGLTLFHIFANIQCMKTVAFPYFNLERLKMVAGAYMDSWSQGKSHCKLPSPMQIGRSESLLFLPKGRQRHAIRFGVSFNELTEPSHVNPIVCRDLLEANGYCCVTTTPSSRRHRVVMVVLTADATPYIKTKAYFHAMLLQRVLEKIPPNSNPQQNDGELAEYIALQEIESAWERFVQDATASFWDINQSNLQTMGYEVWFANAVGGIEPLL